MRALLVIFLFGVFSNICYSQKNADINDIHNVYDEKGDYYFDKKEFKKAIVYYNMAYKHDANNYYSVLRKAETFTSLELYDQAAECYRLLFETDLYIPNEHRLKFALLLLKNKDITGFEKWMGKYNEIVNSEIHGYISSAEVRAKMYKDTSFVVVENESVLNTVESEICPVVYQDYILFASTRKNLAGSAGNNYYNLFSASYVEGGHLGRLNSFNTSLNSSQSISSISFYDYLKSLYFTRSLSKNSKLKTYITSIPVHVNDKLDVKEFLMEGFSSIGHVSFNSKGTTMYFVSEAPGGSGGLDIYSSDLTGSKWGKPKNLGKNINSGKDEMYPVVMYDTILYFSSAGHNGLGGFDLYSVNLKQENSTPTNLGSNVNSEYDDYGLSFSSGGLTGYFCSNRPGGFGKEDIYRVHLMDIKVKLPAYKFKSKPKIEKDKINLYLSNGDEYNIISKDKTGFNFGFLPEEGYKMVIQHENPLVSNIIYNNKLTEEQKKKEFLNPEPIEKTEIRLQAGMKYQFIAGMKPISTDYKKALDEMSKEYQNPNSNTIDLTALAKELLIKEGEIYTIRFEKDDSQFSDEKAKGESGLFINDQTISVSGRSFFIVLPLDIQANFNIQTDIAHFKETFSPKKAGAVKVDAAPVYKEEPVKQSEGFPILVNTESLIDAISGKKISATELTIIPGTMYILSFRKTDAGPEDPGVVVPLTKGVKYNLGTEVQSDKEYNKALSQMTSGQAGNNNPNEELIDISVLSKELDVVSEKNIVFSLVPAKQFASQAAGARNVLTTLAVDGRKYYIASMQKLQVNLKLDQNKKVNIQTDLAYVKENFDPSTIAIKVDTTSFHTALAEKNKNIITDPVYDVIVANFNLNDYSIRPDAKNIIADKVIQVLKGDSRLYVTIKGYTDPLGDAAYNEKLSRNRAQTVKDFLTNNGIGENRIRTFSYGESLAPKDGVKWEDLSEEELQKYRKVEIVIYLPK
jgi:outer membrane protein OmpA-like peptidoglycan-associated protein